MSKCRIQESKGVKKRQQELVAKKKVGNNDVKNKRVESRQLCNWLKYSKAL